MSQEQVIKKLSVDVVASEPSTVTISRGPSDISSLHDVNLAIHDIQLELAKISAQYDSVATLMSPIMTGTENAINYSTYILGILAAFLTVAAILLQLYLNKQSQKALKDAVREFDDKISAGLIPENSNIRQKIVETVINSPEFISAVQAAAEYSETSEIAEGRATSVGQEAEETMTLQKFTAVKDR